MPGGSRKVDGSYRLFMAPGMAHCGGGEGPNTFDMVDALEQWVEHGSPPAQIIATHSTNGRPDRTRPLCPQFPQIAVYKVRKHGRCDEFSLPRRIERLTPLAQQSCHTDRSSHNSSVR